jgi:magnesium chelatase family protein
MLSQVTSGAVFGVDAYLVRVEVDLTRGLPAMSVVGLPESAVREGRERVTAALHNSGYEVPPQRITVNLAPADVRKEGSAFDLPIALGLLAGVGVLEAKRLRGLCFVGELGLDGRVRTVRGVLPIAILCRQKGLAGLIVPEGNAREAAAVAGLHVRAAGSLRAVVAHIRGVTSLPRPGPGPRIGPADASGNRFDLADVRGQAHVRRALEVAAAGSHNVLMAGPPGAGKSMLARRLPSILPPLGEREAIETTKIHSVAGRLRPSEGLITARPFRAPHHTISDAGLIGGGSVPRPGEVSLAHNGVLFLDEIPEFRRGVLETLRQPLEDGVVHIGRARHAVTYPARFMLVAAMNPCPCGRLGMGELACTCTPLQVQRYLARLSGPLLDRIDLHVTVPPLTAPDVLGRAPGEASRPMRARVLNARRQQQGRFAGRPGVFANAHMRPAEVRAFCSIDAKTETLLRQAIQELGLSARGAHRVLRVARTIADLDDAAGISTAHVAEGIQYRTLDRPAACVPE